MQQLMASVRPPRLVVAGLKLVWFQKPLVAFNVMNEYETKRFGLMADFWWDGHRETRQTHTIYLGSLNLYHSLLL